MGAVAQPQREGGVHIAADDALALGVMQRFRFMYSGSTAWDCQAK